MSDVIVESHLDGYSGVTNKIKQSMYQVAKEFLYIGFLLHEADCFQYYLEKDYSSIYHYAEVELGFKKSSVNNFIRVYETFSDDGKCFIKQKYENFKYSQLTEMLSMSPKQLESVKPDMTVRELRELKKKDKPQDETKETFQTSGRGSPPGVMSLHHVQALEKYLSDRFSKRDGLMPYQEFCSFLGNSGSGCSFSMEFDGEGTYSVDCVCSKLGLTVSFNRNTYTFPYSIVWWMAVAISSTRINSAETICTLEQDNDISDFGKCSCCGNLCDFYKDNFCSSCGCKISR